MRLTFVGTTNTYGALEKARTHFAEEARPTAATAVVLMTDGENSISFFRPEQHANAMKAAGTTIWAVGVGTEVSQTELEAIASPDQVIELEEFAELEAAFELIAGQFTPPAATDLVFSASVPAGFTLVAASAATARGTVIESGNTVAWQVDRLGAETITMTYQIRHDDVATPSGGTLTAVTNAVLTLTTPVGGAAFSEAYADVDTEVTGCSAPPPPTSCSSDRSKKSDKSAKSAKSMKSDKSSKSDKSTKSCKSGRSHKSAKTHKSGKSHKSGKGKKG